MTVRRTACSRDCPDACSILVTVENGRAVALRGDPDDPFTRGFLCERTGRFLDRQYAPDRITTPLLGRGADRRAVSWDEALDVAAERLTAIRAASGPAAILHYRSGGSLGILKSCADLLFEAFGPCTIKRGDICSGAGEAAQERDFGVCDSHDVFDLRHSHTVVLWGKNPHVSGPHLLPELLAARRRGARLLGADPVRTRAAEWCDVFVQPRPGADAALAFGVARRLLDTGAWAPDAADWCDHLDDFERLTCRATVEEWAAEADVAPDALRAFADAYADGPAAILVGWGLARRRNGSSTVRVLDALGAVSGNLGVPGGGVSYYFARRAPFDTHFVRGAEVAPRTLAEARLGHEILAADDPPIRAIWVTAGNPLSMLPDSASLRAAFEALEFSVVVDTHPTDTTDAADLVLPTLTLLEDADVLGSYGSHLLRASTPAVEPPEGPRHELHILQDLAERLGVGDVLAGSVDDWRRRVTRRLAARGVPLEALAERAQPSPFAEPVLFADRRFPTASGRVDLIREAPGPAPEPSPAFPMTLLAVSTPKAQSSQWAVPPEGPMTVTIHPDAAGGVADGGRARLQSGLGELEVRVRHDASMRRDVALAPKGGMARQRRCVNDLVDAVETDDGGGAAYYDSAVRLVPVDERMDC